MMTTVAASRARFQIALGAPARVPRRGDPRHRGRRRPHCHSCHPVRDAGLHISRQSQSASRPPRARGKSSGEPRGDCQRRVRESGAGVCCRVGADGGSPASAIHRTASAGNAVDEPAVLNPVNSMKRLALLLTLGSLRNRAARHRRRRRRRDPCPVGHRAATSRAAEQVPKADYAHRRECASWSESSATRRTRTHLRDKLGSRRNGTDRSRPRRSASVPPGVVRDVSRLRRPTPWRRRKATVRWLGGWPLSALNVHCRPLWKRRTRSKGMVPLEPAETRWAPSGAAEF